MLSSRKLLDCAAAENGRVFSPIVRVRAQTFVAAALSQEFHQELLGVAGRIGFFRDQGTANVSVSSRSREYAGPADFERVR